MADNPSNPLHSEIMELGATYTLEELCITCDVKEDWVAELVEHGAIDPDGPARASWQFTRLSVVRVAKARRLERDLDLNMPGIALALDLLDEIEDLRARLRAIK